MQQKNSKFNPILCFISLHSHRCIVVCAPTIRHNSSFIKNLFDFISSAKKGLRENRCFLFFNVVFFCVRSCVGLKFKSKLGANKKVSRDKNVCLWTEFTQVTHKRHCDINFTLASFSSSSSIDDQLPVDDERDTCCRFLSVVLFHLMKYLLRQVGPKCVHNKFCSMQSTAFSPLTDCAKIIRLMSQEGAFMLMINSSLWSTYALSLYIII